MRLTLPTLLACILAPILCAQTTATTPNRPLNQQIMLAYGGSPDSTSFGEMQFGYEFQVLSGIGATVPEVVELGAAKPGSALSLPAGYYAVGGKVKVSLWHVTGATTGTKIASADVDWNANWAWTTLAQPVQLTPGEKYRVVMLAKVATDIYETGTNTFIATSNNTNCYLNHHTSNPALTLPTGPTIQYTQGVYADGGTWPGTATENTYPVEGGGTNPWGMADIGWREAQVAPSLAAPVTNANTNGVLIAEVGPDVATGGWEGGELQNVSSRWQDISGYKIYIYDSQEAATLSISQYEPVAVGTVPQGTSIAPGAVFTFGEAGAGVPFQLAFGAWSWATSSLSAVVLTNAAGTVIDVVRVNNFSLGSITNPVNTVASHWSGSFLSQWSTAHSWQRIGSSDSDTTTGWNRTSGQSVGTSNSAISTPFSGAGMTFPTIGGTDPNFTATLRVGDDLKLVLGATDLNSANTLTLTATHSSGMDPASAGFTNLTTTTPASNAATGAVTLTLNGTAAAAGSLVIAVSVNDGTGRSDSYSISVTIDPEYNFVPQFSASYNVGSGNVVFQSGATFGSQANPIAFGVALSTYGFQFNLNDGNGDAVAVTASLQLNPTSAQQGMTAADFEHAAQVGPYSYQPVGTALFAHLNALQCTFTLTLTADDGNGGTRQFSFTFIVAPKPANAVPTISVSRNGASVPNNGHVVVAPNDTLAGLNLQIAVNDADNHAVRLVGTVGSVTTQGLLSSEFTSGGFLATSYTLSPTSGQFTVPGILHQVTLEADDNQWLGTSSFTFFFVVNRAPALAVTSGGQPVQNGGTVVANYLDTLASLALAISVSDPDGNPTAVGAGVSGVTSQGFVAAEFAATQQAVSYQLAPTSGTFNDVNGSSHVVTLTATDLYGGTAVFSFTLSANPNAPVLEMREGNGTLIHSGSAAADGRVFGIVDVNSGASTALTVELANVGSGPFTVDSVTITGPNAADFVGGTASLPASVTPGSPAYFTVAFDPTLNGVKEATVNVNYTHSGSSLTAAFAVKGTGYDALGPSLLTSTLPQAVAASAYAPTQLQVSGGQAGFAWTVISGQLPPGLTLDAAGTISGVVQGFTAATYTFKVRVTDVLGATDDREFAITVVDKNEPVISGSGSAGGGGCEVSSGGGLWLLALLPLLWLTRRKRSA